MKLHHLDRRDPADVAMAQARIRPETQGAESVLHDMGVLSIFGSDSMAMGNLCETIITTWQLASVTMKERRGRLKEEQGDNDNFRVKRYVSKYTINPAITHGISHVVGSIEVGKMADLVLWRPEFFGVKPNTVVKGGCYCYEYYRRRQWKYCGDSTTDVSSHVRFIWEGTKKQLSHIYVTGCNRSEFSPGPRT